MSTILVTGASGFLGSALVNWFAEKNHQVFAVVRKNSLLDRLNTQHVNVEICRISREDDVVDLVKNAAPDFVLHTACSYGRQGESTYDIFMANVQMGMTLINAVLATERPCTFVNTGTVLNSELSFYALCKNQFSELGKRIALSTSNNLQFIDVALQHMYGPGDSSIKFTTHIIRACLKNVDALQLTSGIQQRDFLFIDDVVSAYEILLEKSKYLPAYDRVEVGSGQAPPLRAIVEKVKQLSGANTQLLFGSIPLREGEDMLCVANIEKLQALGWAPRHTLEEGLIATINHERKVGGF